MEFVLYKYQTTLKQHILYINTHRHVHGGMNVYHNYH